MAHKNKFLNMDFPLTKIFSNSLRDGSMSHLADSNGKLLCKKVLTATIEMEATFHAPEEAKKTFKPTNALHCKACRLALEKESQT